MAGARGVVDLSVYRKVKEAVDLYNRYRSPEATARILEFNGERLVVKFEGSFCETCGINDWVEDLVYVMRDLGLDAEIVEVVEPDDLISGEEWRIGVFKVKRVGEKEDVGGGAPG